MTSCGRDTPPTRPSTSLRLACLGRTCTGILVCERNSSDEDVLTMSDSDVSDELESSEPELKMFGFGHEPKFSGKDMAAQAVASIRAVNVDEAEITAIGEVALHQQHLATGWLGYFEMKRQPKQLRQP